MKTNTIENLDWPDGPSRNLAFPVNLNPLIEALSCNKAVAFVGAGPSMAAGLPSWEELLKSCLDYAKGCAGVSKDSWKLADRFLAQGDFLTVAELLQNGLKQELEKFLWAQFSNELTPSDIHYALARMPFSLFLTTNYDRLLELAFLDAPFVCTWKEPESFFSFIKHRRRPTIVKTHGDIGKPPTLVLTRSSYRDMIHAAEQFNACVRSLLTLRTFLFVGTSLRDPDLLHLIDESRLLFKDEFGPHYAILFDGEADIRFVDFLKQSYNIESLVLKPKSGVDFLPGERTRLLVELLQELSGRANLCRHRCTNIPSIDNPLFNLPDACDAILRNAVDLTSSLRGEVCFVLQEELRALTRLAYFPEDKFSYLQKGVGKSDSERIPPNSLIGRVYLRSSSRDVPQLVGHKSFRGFSGVKLGPHCINIPDVRDRNAIQSIIGFGDSEYHEVYSEVRSELLCPIYSEGQIVGVLNVESDLPSAYTPFHQEILQRVSDQAGWLFYEARNRRKAATSIMKMMKSPDRFASLVNLNRLLKPLNLKHLLWVPSMVDGKLIAQTNAPRKSKQAEPFEYRLDEPSLAQRVLRFRERLIVPDAELELGRHDCILAKAGCEEFDIHGPVMACPLNIDGETAAILVSWSETLGKGESLQSIFNSYPVDIQTVDERIYRAAHLIVNDPDLVAGTAQEPATAATFLKKLDECAQSLNYSGVQDGMPFPIDELRSNSHFRNELALKLIQVLADPSCGLPRARLWVRNGRESNARFSVWRSWTDPVHTTTNKSQIDAYSGIEVTQDDPYVQYSLARFRTDPYARHQHESMFGSADDNNGKLDKTPNCPWIVGLIANSQLWGFLSADDHYPNMPNSYLVEGLDEPPRKAFQRRCVDLVCHFLSSVVFCEALSRVSSKPQSTASQP